jgi:hypothetical protein
MRRQVRELAAPTPGRRRRSWPRRAGVASCVAAGLLVGLTQMAFVEDRSAEARAEATAAVKALRDGDLLALDEQLAANRGRRDFAYHFTSQTTPRMLGDALGAVAGTGEVAPSGRTSTRTRMSSPSPTWRAPPPWPPTAPGPTPCSRRGPTSRTRIRFRYFSF